MDSANSLSLLQGLVHQWTQFFAFVTSFLTVLILWVGHHETFTYVVRTDRRFMLLNGFFLFFVTPTPFTTSLVPTTYSRATRAALQPSTQEVFFL